MLPLHIVISYNNPPRTVVYSSIPIKEVMDLITTRKTLIPATDVKIHYVAQAVIPVYLDDVPSLSVLLVCASHDDIIHLGKSKQVFLHNSIHDTLFPFSEMECVVKTPLIVRVGDISWALSFEDEQLVLHKFHSKFIDRIRDTVSDPHGILKYAKFPHWAIDDIRRAPYIVIGHKIHISLGTALTFDTEKETWACSNLFESFWTQHNPDTLVYPPILYYYEERHGPLVAVSPNRRPFGFYGRAILMSDNVFLGISEGYYQIVAFKLDDAKERVVQAQCFDVDDDPEDVENATKRLVDLGNGYFGFVYSIDEGVLHRVDSTDSQIVMAIYQVSEPQGDGFFGFSFVNKIVLSKNYPCFMDDKYDVSCV